MRKFPIINYQLSNNVNNIENLGIGNSLKIGNWKLKIAKDLNKDQSYFLWNLTQEHLKRTLFPIGNMQKVDMKDFLKHYLPSQKGDVLNEKGEAIGWHEGAYFYTIGQRHGFIITKKSSEDKPYYIISKDIPSNAITVSHSPIAQGISSSKRITISGTNWIDGELPNFIKKYKARIRYREPLQACRIEIAEKKDTLNSRFLVIFDLPQAVVSRGQSLVIYDGENCIGGGIIDNFE